MKFTARYFLFFHSRKLYLLPVVCFATLFLHSLVQRNLQIFPGLDKDKTSAFDDHESGGDSHALLRDSGSGGISIEYTLGGKIQYPYSGIKLVIKNGDRYKDLSGYDYLSVVISTTTEQEINIFLHTVIPGFTDELKTLTYGYQLKTVKCTQPRQRFLIPLTSFAVPTWWYVLNKIPDDSIKSEKFNRVAEIIIENGYDFKVGVPYSITVHSLLFQRSIAKRALFTFIAIIIWILLYTLLYLIYKNSTHKHAPVTVEKIVIPYESLELGNDSDSCLDRIVTSIARKYTIQSLTIRQIADDVGVSPAKITQTLKEKKSCSYKQYLNSIRLHEAKRLLIETDKNIVEIAQKVGYNNISHFNRIFKELEGVSPRQFRTAEEDNQSTPS